MNENLTKISSLLLLSAQKHILRKAIFSKPSDKNLLKAVMCEKTISGKPVLQVELFHKDNKVTHKNLPIEELNEDFLAQFGSEYSQINLITSSAECEYRLSSSGKSVLLNEKKAQAFIYDAAAKQADKLESNNRQKNYILSGNEPFLKLLGVSDQNGRVYDKKQSKFKQINRFLEIIRDCEDKLPKDKIRICDLCCGKSYLSFAAYHYFSIIKGMKVCMTGIDLKADVIEHCSSVAKALGFDGLDFICMDINEYEPSEKPSLVISLHACDIATDIVLVNAAKWQADVILSTPCCHHELNHSIKCESLSFITEYSMLRQKLCDAATDALRLCRLESQGYFAEAIELIDPVETPKNIMLRAVRNKSFDPSSKQAIATMERYTAAKKFLCENTDFSKLHF